jgi:Tripartite tricarboxylate transporter family receptor/Putative transposase
VVLSPEEAARLLDAAPGLKYNAALSVAYGAGLRAAEVISLKVVRHRQQTDADRRGAGQGPQVTFKWKDYRIEGPERYKVVTLATHEFVRRFLMHVLPAGFPALTDLLAGQVQVIFDVMSNSIEYIRAGKLRALAVTTATRSQALPDIPTLGEFVPGYEASSVYGLGAAKNTPAEIVDRFNKDINAGLADPNIKERLAALGGTVLASSPSAYGTLIAAEIEKWAKVVKFAGARVD